MISLKSRLRLSDDVLFQEVEGEAVLLDLRSEQYFSLNAVGVDFWRALESDPSVADAHAHLLTLYQVDATELENDIVRLAGELERAGLVSDEAN